MPTGRRSKAYKKKAPPPIIVDNIFNCNKIKVNCDNPKNNKPKCVHFGGEHTANYRGCIVAKKIQKL